MAKLKTIRPQILAIPLAGGALVAVWVACSNDPPAVPGALDGSGAAAGAPVTGGVSGEGGEGGFWDAGQAGKGNDGGGTDAEPPPPYPNAVPCADPGWYALPQTPQCTDMCIPDDASLRVPAIGWMDRSDWCDGCRWLSRPDGEPDRFVAATVAGVTGLNTARTLSFLHADGSATNVLFEPDGRILAAIRVLRQWGCGRYDGIRWSVDGHVGVRIIEKATMRQTVAFTPVEESSRLFSATPAWTWDPLFMDGRTSNSWHFSTDLVAENLLGRLVVGELTTGKTVVVDSLPSAQVGQYGSLFQVVGDAVVTSRFDGYRSDYNLYRDGEIYEVMGAPEIDIDRLITDEVWLVWNEGSDPDPSAQGRMVPRRFDLYRSVYAESRTAVQRELLFPDVGGRFYGRPVLVNGWFVGTVLYTSAPPHKAELLAVRVADGYALRSRLPEGYSWGKGSQYPTDTEVWGGINETALNWESHTIARIPYSAMQVVQTTLPQ